MKIDRLRVLRGPGVWTRFPVLEVTLEVAADGAAERAAAVARCFPGWVRSVAPGDDTASPGGEETDARDWNPRLRASAGDPAGCRDDGAVLAAAWAAVVAGLQSAAWKPVTFARVERPLGAGLYRVLVGYEDEELAEACAHEALQLCASCDGPQPPDRQAAIDRMRAVAARVCLPDSVWAIVTAARTRGIPWRRVSRAGVLQLGFGSRQRRASRVAGVPAGSAAELHPVDQELVGGVLHALAVPCTTWPEGELPADRELHRVLVVGPRLVAAVRVDRSRGPSEVTDQVHAAVATRCVEAAQALQLDVAVFDLLVRDLTQPLGTQPGGVVRVHPGLVGEEAFAAPEILTRFGQAVVAQLFPDGATGRIPLVSVTGVNGKTTTTRLIARMLEALGQRVGMTCTDGVFASGRSIEDGDCAGPKSARRVLANPFVDAGVLEVARGGILREGLGFDGCDVAVVTNIADGDHLGISWVKTPEELAQVKGVIVEAVAPHGHAVLKADDPLVVAMAARCPGQIVYFCRQTDHPVVQDHRRTGGRAVLERDGTVIIAAGSREIPVIAVTDIPLTRGGRLTFQIENVLAAVAAAHCLGVPLDRLRQCLQTFDSDLQTCPGRFNMLEYHGATVILDYGHNPAAVKALAEAIERFPATRRHVVYSADGDRTDLQIRQQAANLAGTFDRVVLYEEPSRFRGRQTGEIYQLLRAGLAGGTRVSEIEQVDGEVAAIRYALETVQPGELVLIQVDAVATDLAFVRQYLGADQPAAKAEP